MSPEYYSALYTRSCFMFSQLYTERFKAALSWLTCPLDHNPQQPRWPTNVAAEDCSSQHHSAYPWSQSCTFSMITCFLFVLIDLFLFFFFFLCEALIVLLSLPSLYSWYALVLTFLDYCLGYTCLLFAWPLPACFRFWIVFWISLPVNSTCVNIPLRDAPKWHYLKTRDFHRY